MSNPVPSEINLHRLSRVLEISFDDGSNFKLPAEYLRVFSPSAEVMGHGPGQRQVPTGKENVNIDRIDPTTNTTPASTPGKPCTIWASTSTISGSSILGS